MNINIYGFIDYKKYLRAIVRAQPARGHGFKSKLAKAANCQRTYISLVFSKASLNLSLEQGLGISKLLQHTEKERQYFLLILQFAKAGTQELKNFFLQDIQSIQEEQTRPSKRLKEHQEIDEQAKLEYYGHWYYGAVFLLANMQKFQERIAIAQRLQIPIEQVNQAIDFLLKNKILYLENGKLKANNTKLFLSNESLIAMLFHKNWRNRAIEKMSIADTKDYFYSTQFSIAKKDFEIIKKFLTDTIEKSVETVIDSKEEDIYQLNIDWFRI